MHKPTPFPELGNGPYRVLRGFARPLVDLFQHSLEDPEAVQRQSLARILENAKGTAFSKDHGLRGDEALASFRERVPVRGYDGLMPYLRRVHEAEPEVLTRSPVRGLLKTSGTTGAAKLVPVTDPYAREVADGQALWRLALVRDHEEASRGKALTLVSPAIEGFLPSGLPYGSNTGRMHHAQPWIVRLRYAVPNAVYRVEDPELRLYCAMRYALQSRLSSITTANPSTLLLIARRLEEHQDALARDLADGTLRQGPAAALSTRQRLRFAVSLRKVRPPEDWRPGRIWSLATINCWKGGAAPFFLSQLQSAYDPSTPVREVGITASEGYFAIPLGDDDAGGVAWLGGHLLEFLDDEDRAHWAWELESGRQYRLVITTSAGLYRYDLGDVVEVVGWLGRVPRLRFVRKVGNVLNLTGEKLTEDQVVRAVREALGDAQLVGFTVGYRLSGDEQVPALTLAAEGAVSPGLVERFDAALRAANVEYDSKRDSGRLGLPRLERLNPGTYARYRARRVAEGAPDGQVKDLVVALDNRHWEQLIRD